MYVTLSHIHNVTFRLVTYMPDFSITYHFFIVEISLSLSSGFFELVWSWMEYEATVSQHPRYSFSHHDSVSCSSISLSCQQLVTTFLLSASGR